MRMERPSIAVAAAKTSDIHLPKRADNVVEVGTGEYPEHGHKDDERFGTFAQD